MVYYSWHALDLPAGAGPTLTPEGSKFFKALVTCKRPKICHNLKADYTFIANSGLHMVGPYHDTLLMHCLIDEHDLDFHALKPLARKLLGRPRDDENILHEYQARYPKMICNLMLLKHHQEILHNYALADAEDPLQLFYMFERQLKAQGSWENYLNEVKAELAYIAMEWRGVKLDLNKIIETQRALEGPIENMRQAMFREFGEEFNPNSPAQLSKQLLKKVKLVKRNEPSKTEIAKAAKEHRAPVGSYCTDKETLMDFLHEPAIQYLFAYRYMTKSYGTLTTYQEHMDPVTQRARCDVRQTTTTGRTAISGLPLQQIPKQKGKLTEVEVGDKLLAEQCSEAYRMVRAAFVAGPGGYIYSNDYMQIEYYVAAHYSGSQRLIDMLRSGIDFHEATCRLVFNRYEDHLRNLIKIINYGMLYGMGLDLLTIRIKFYTNEDPEAVVKRYETSFPEMRALQIQSKLRLDELGTTHFGRRYHYDPARPHAIVSWLCQGTAAQIKKHALVRVHNIYQEANAKSGIIMDIHDDLVQEVFPQDVDLLKPIHDAMEDFPMFDVPIRVDSSIGLDLLNQKKCSVEQAQALLRNEITLEELEK